MIVGFIVFYKVNMNIKQKITIFAFIAVFASLAFAGMSGMTASAAAETQGCGNVEKTAIIKCEGYDPDQGDVNKNPIWYLLLLALNILTAGVGIVAVGGIVYGSILYATARDKADQVKKAISVIMNVVIGLVAYVAMYAVLQFLIPGGIFS
jgi:hypothetical protein